MSSVAMPSRKVSEGIYIDHSLWPILIVTPPEGRKPNDRELEEFMVAYKKQIDRDKKERYGIILDLRESPGLDSKQRKMLTNFMNESDHLEEYCALTAMIFKSLPLRGMLTAIFWLFKPPYPTRVFGGLDEALTWARTILYKRNSLSPT